LNNLMLVYKGNDTRMILKANQILCVIISTNSIIFDLFIDLRLVIEASVNLIFN